MSPIATTERRARFWLLLADCYQQHAAAAKTDAQRATWLQRAAAALETAAAPLAT